MSRFLLFPLSASLLLVSCQPEEKSALTDRQVESYQESVSALEAEVAELRVRLVEERNKRTREEAEQQALRSELREMTQSARETQQLLAEKLGAIEVPQEEGKPVPEEEKPTIAEARRMARDEARGETLEVLLTRSGDRYHDLIISRVTDLGVVFRHRTGIARIPFSDLDPAWGDRFYHDPELAARAEKAEREAQARRDRALAEQMNQKREEEAEAEAGERLLQLAQAVADLRRENQDTQSQLRRVTFTSPWIHGSSWWSPFFAPPVICSPVFHDDFSRVPVIRTQRDPAGPVLQVPPLRVPTLRTPTLREPGPSTRSPRSVPPRVIVPPSSSRSTTPATRQSRIVPPRVVSPRVIRPSTTGRAPSSSRVIRRTR